MIKDGNYFTANVTLPSDSIVYITYKFVSESAIDDNNLQWWDIFLYDNTGKELEGGHYQKALSSLFSYDLKRKMDVSDARKELEKEIELYPDNIFALQTKWLNDIKVSNEDTSVVKDVQEKLRSAYEKWKTDEEATHYIAYAADYAKMTGLLNVIRDYYSIKSPKGKVIRLIRYFEALREKDPDKKIPLLKKYLEDFDNADPQTKDIIIGNIYDALNQKQDRDGLRKFFKEYKFDDIYYYINIGEIEFSNGNNIKEFKKWWDDSYAIHLLGRDILKFHAIYWPAMLIAGGIKLPDQEFIHGFFTINNQKMSKTLGNVIDPNKLVDKFGADAARYLLLSQFPFGSDGNIQETKFEEQYNSNLANGLGNLIERTFALLRKYNYKAHPLKSATKEFENNFKKHEEEYYYCMNNLDLFKALENAFSLTREIDKYINKKKPWSIPLDKPKEINTILTNLLSGLSKIVVFLEPFIPFKLDLVKKRINEGDFSKINLFPRIVK